MVQKTTTCPLFCFDLWSEWRLNNCPFRTLLILWGFSDELRIHTTINPQYSLLLYINLHYNDFLFLVPRVLKPVLNSGAQLQYQPVSGVYSTVLHSDDAQAVKSCYQHRPVTVQQPTWHVLNRAGYSPGLRFCMFVTQHNLRRISNVLQDAPAPKRPSSASVLRRSHELYRTRSTHCEWLNKQQLLSPLWIKY